MDFVYYPEFTVDHQTRLPLNYYDNIATNSSMNATHSLPTPPHSPSSSTRHEIESLDLDELLENVPEILETPSFFRPPVLSDILIDLEATCPLYFADSLDERDFMEASQLPENTAPVIVEQIKQEIPIKNDIMWGIGNCCGDDMIINERKQRNYSECSIDSGREVSMQLHHDTDSEEEHMPDTPSGTDTDGEDVSYIHDIHRPAIVIKNEHNYCEQIMPVPEATLNLPGGHSRMQNYSDTDDDVDVVNTVEPTYINRTAVHSQMNYLSLPTTSTSKSQEVRNRLHCHIQGNRNKQKTRLNQPPSPGTSPPHRATTTKAVVKRLGKPESYTKRMMNSHAEVLSKKGKKKNRGEDDEGRRSVHNSLERQRRVELRNAFDLLRQLVPDTKENEKAPKVQILKKAAAYCNSLVALENELGKELKIQQQRSVILQNRIHHLS